MNVVICDKCQKQIGGIYTQIDITKGYRDGLYYDKENLDLCESCYKEIKSYIQLGKEK